MKLRIRCDDCGTLLKEVEDTTYANDRSITTYMTCEKCRELKRRLYEK